jgi:hypothetical protein
VHVSGHGGITRLQFGAKIIDDLKANILIGMDILESEKIDVFISESKLKIGSCQILEIPVEIKFKRERIKRIVQARTRTTVVSRSVIMVAITVKGKGTLAENKDFIFKPADIDMGPEQGITVNLINANTTFVEIRNTFDKSIIIDRKRCFDIITENAAKSCFPAHEKIRSLASEPISNWKKATRLTVLAFGTAVTIISKPEIMAINGVTQIDLFKKMVTDNGIIVYGNDDTRNRFFNVANYYPNLW